MTAIASSPTPYHELVARVCRRVPPSFRLEDFVAVSPFVGYAELPFLDAHAALERRLHADLLPDLETLRALFARGAFDADDVAASVRDFERAHAEHPDAPHVDAALALGLLEDTLGVHPATETPRRAEVVSIAERIDRAEGTRLRESIVESIARLAAEQHDRGVARIGSPLRGRGLYESFRLTAPFDRTLEEQGVHGWRSLLDELPDDVDDAFEHLLGTTDLGQVPIEDYLGRLLAEVKGWAGALRAIDFPRDANDVGAVPELLLLRLVYDVALTRAERIGRDAVPRAPRLLGGPPQDAPRLDVVLRYVLLGAAERGFRRDLARRLGTAETVTRALETRERPTVQAVFCIDVRSEPLRRALEATTSAVETYGFAGFFGMPIAVRHGARHDAQPQCPALIEPSLTVDCEHGGQARRGTLASVLDELRNATFGGFTYVETMGFGALGTIVRETLGLARIAPPSVQDAHVGIDAIDPAKRLDLATSALTNLGLRAPYGRLLLLVGHDATSANDPLRAGLSCGACSGHGGAPNARLLAALLNDATVRRGLATRGFRLPDDLHVLPAVHDTTTDVVRLLELATVPASHRDDVRVAEAMLGAATRTVRAQRALGLPGLGTPHTPGELARRLEERAHDWAEVRPEWALAGNAAFVAARRERTRGADLGGRVFLHSYDRTLDADGAVLRLLLNAPVVVASFINLQYYGSTIAKDALGSGTKTLHNVSGGVGVTVGNGGDLAIGLSLQSVNDGHHDRHEPLRLQVIVEDTVERIEAVLAESPTLAAMVANDYLFLYALEPEGDRIERVRGSSSKAHRTSLDVLVAGGDS